MSATKAAAKVADARDDSADPIKTKETKLEEADKSAGMTDKELEAMVKELP
jgi:hypothetical protein